MEKPFEYIGHYDFLCIFGAGIITFVFWIILILASGNNLQIFACYSHNIQADWSLHFIFISAVICYFIGVILQSIAKFFRELSSLDLIL